MDNRLAVKGTLVNTQNKQFYQEVREILPSDTSFRFFPNGDGTHTFLAHKNGKINFDQDLVNLIQQILHDDHLKQFQKFYQRGCLKIVAAPQTIINFFKKHLVK